MSLHLSALVVCVCILWTAPAHTQTVPVPPLEPMLSKIFAAWNVPGASVAIVKDGQVIMVKGFGSTGGTPSVNTNERTAFYTASVTKTFTVAALGMLADEGKFRLDDPIVKHLPEFATGDPSVTAALTVRDLMSHRTGLPRADLLMFSGFTAPEILTRMGGLAPVAPIRSRFTYQNQMYLALGELVARLSGQSWTQFVSGRILSPLGMTDSTATGLGYTADGQVTAHPHARINGVVTPVPLVPRAPYGAGGINASARDMGTWLQFLLGDGTWKGTKLLGPQVINATRNPQILTPVSYFAPEAVLSAYGLGWFLNDHRGHLIVQHGGNGEGWTSLVWMQPDLKLGVAVLTNMHNTMLPWAMAYSVADAYSGAPARDWTAHYKALEASRDAAQDTQLPVAQAGLIDATTWLGTYTSAVYGELRIVGAGDDLELQYGPSLRATLRPVTGGVAAFWQRSDILAVLGPSAMRQITRGGQSALVLQLGGDTIEFIRAR